MTRHTASSATQIPKLHAGQALADASMCSALARTASRNGSAVIIAIDIIGFEYMSKALTPECAAHIANAVSRRIVASMRRTDLLSRTAAGRFTLLANNSGLKDSVARIVARLHEDIERPVMVSDICYTPVVAIGVAHYPADAKSVDGLVEHAVAALQRSKPKHIAGCNTDRHQPTTLARTAGPNRFRRQQY